MKDIAKIVVPVDLDRHTEKLVEFAVFFANKLSASLRLIHIVENVSTGDMMLGSPSFEPIYKEQKVKAEELMANIVTDSKRKLADVSGTVIRGEVVEEIVNYATEEQAGLIIMGTHGNKGLERILLGSVAERVLKRAHCPTLTMNPYK